MYRYVEPIQVPFGFISVQKPSQTCSPGGGTPPHSPTHSLTHTFDSYSLAYVNSLIHSHTYSPLISSFTHPLSFGIETKHMDSLLIDWPCPFSDKTTGVLWRVIYLTSPLLIRLVKRQNCSLYQALLSII